MQLVVEVAMHRGFDRGGAYPDACRPVSAVRKPSSQPPKLQSDMTRQGRESAAGMAARNAAQWFFSWPSISARAGTTSG